MALGLAGDHGETEERPMPDPKVTSTILQIRQCRAPRV